MLVFKEYAEEEGFKPFYIKLLVQNAEEARALYAIFNHYANVELLDETLAKEIREEIGDKYYVEEREIANGVTAINYYHPKVVTDERIY